MMKHFVLFPAFVLFLGFSILNQTQNKSNYIANESNNVLKLQCPSPPSFEHLAKDQIKKDSKDINPNWYGKTIENIRSGEYNISYSEDLKSYQSPNRANNIRFIYHNDGFTAKTRESKIPLFDLNDKTIREEDKKYETIPEWSVRFKMLSLRCEDQDVNNVQSSMTNVQFDGREFNFDKNKGSIENDNLRINYTNDKRGMRQDFVIRNRPNGEGKLRLELSAETKLKMIIGSVALMFKDKNGDEKMNYSALKVWDANMKELRAYFETTPVSIEKLKIENENHSNEIPNQKFQSVRGGPNHHQLTNQQINQFTICVNDENAAYPITVDPLSTSPNWTAESNQANAGFGYSVSTAGDVNGDGYSDVIVGAPFYDNGQTDEGRAFVYYGSARGLLPIANWTAESNQANAQFGWSVSTAGDVNGDGYSDVIVGANVYDNDQIDEGKVFVYYGSILGLSSIANWTAESNQSSSQFGWSVSTAGDVNNDGYSDVIVGAPLYDSGQEDEGRVFVYFGSASGLPSTANWVAESDQASSNFGISVSTAGDVNGDGHSDIIVGANRYDNPLIDEGCAFIYYGSVTGLPSTISWRSESHALAYFAYFGISVSTAGDVNGDGYSDVIVGAYAYDNGQTDEGKVFVYYGFARGLSPTANWTAESDQAYARFGYSVSTAGDLNNDGYSDIIIGAREYDNGETNEGSVFVYYGSATGLSSSPIWTAESNQANAYFGCSVSTAGDVNNDGYSDVIVGAYLYDTGQTNEGSAFVYHGSALISKILTLTAFVQGFYNANINSMVGDTVSVYLRNTSSPYAIADSAKAYLNSSGTGTFSFANASNGVNYYIQIKHRNSIETWSAIGQSFINNFLNYNFSILLTQAFGNNMTLIDASPLRFAIYNGDVNQDGVVDISDLSSIYNLIQMSSGGSVGYVPQDVNYDGICDIVDLSIVYNNSKNSVSAVRPLSYRYNKL